MLAELGAGRSIHAAPLRRAVREGAPADPRADKSRLTACKQGGARLGNPTNAPAAAALGRDAQVSDADRFAANVLPVIETIQAAGITSLRGIAAALNARGVPTARGGR